MKKLSQDQIEAALENVVSQGYAAYDNNSYTAGMFLSMLTRLIGDLPAHQQRAEVAQLDKIAAVLQERASLRGVK